MERRALFSPQRQLELVLAVASKTSEHLRREALIVNSHLQKIQRACRAVPIRLRLGKDAKKRKEGKKEKRKKKERRRKGPHFCAHAREEIRLVRVCSH